jgi:hypothetical protein
MTQGKKRSRFSFSQDQDFTEVVIVLPTQTAKKVFYWAILPVGSTLTVWFSGILPNTKDQQSQALPPAHSVAEQVQPTKPKALLPQVAEETNIHP